MKEAVQYYNYERFARGDMANRGSEGAIYTLEELAEASGVSPRTIRFYTTEGVLPPPVRGRFAVYSACHYNRLRLILLLKSALMPLATIRTHLPQLTDAQVVSLLAKDLVTESEVEYISEDTGPHEVDAGQALEQQVAYQALSEALSARSQEATATGSEIPSSSATRRRALLVSPVLAPADWPTPSHDESRLTLKDEIARHPANDTWQRIILAPGVELHVRIPETDQDRAQLDRVIEDARELFGGL